MNDRFCEKDNNKSHDGETVTGNWFNWLRTLRMGELHLLKFNWRLFPNLRHCLELAAPQLAIAFQACHLPLASTSFGRRFHPRRINHMKIAAHRTVRKFNSIQLAAYFAMPEP